MGMVNGSLIHIVKRKKERKTCVAILRRRHLKEEEKKNKENFDLIWWRQINCPILLPFY